MRGVHVSRDEQRAHGQALAFLTALTGAWSVLCADGKIGAFLEERVNMGVNFVLSAELDHSKKDYKFGFGECCAAENAGAPGTCMAQTM